MKGKKMKEEPMQYSEFAEQQLKIVEKALAVLDALSNGKITATEANRISKEIGKEQRELKAQLKLLKTAIKT
jgi:hypothetical protein